MDLNTNTLKQNNDLINPILHTSLLKQIHHYHLQTNQRQSLEVLINKYKDVFSKSKTDVGYISFEQHQINLTTNLPIFIRPYRTSPSEQKIIDETIQDLLKKGFVRPSMSPYSSPVTLAEKKGEGKTRMCIDYRKLNAITVNDHQPIPRIDDILDKLSNKRYFSKLDISSGYWHVRMAPEDIPKTAFSTQRQHLEWVVMPFGLKNAPATFQRVLRQLILKYNLTNVENYFDDIIIFSDTFDDHLQHIEDVMKACQMENIKLKQNKCQFGQNRIDYLGHTISFNAVQPNADNVSAIHNFPTPTTTKELQRFLGMENVYHKYIPNHAIIRAPLTKLLEKDAVWNWSPACEEAFQQLKAHLINKPVLNIFNPTLSCIMYCDASKQGVGAVLKQIHKNNEELPIAYFSRKLRKHEENYAITELECLAIVEALKKWHCYVHGRQTTIVTDHAALQWLRKYKDLKGKLFRWSLRLSTYDLIIKYKCGNGNYEADALSRAPQANLISIEEIKNHQEQMTDKDNFEIINGLRMRRRKGLDKIVVPTTLREKVLEQAHNQFGHIGTKKMLSLISPTYYWPNIIIDINNFAKHCDVCQKNKKTKIKKFATLDQLPPAEKPFDLLSIDTICGLGGYGSTKTMVHLVTDHCTRYAWVFPHTTTSTQAYVGVLQQLLKLGPIKQILSDRAAAFLSPGYKRFLEENGIKRLLTSSQNPQCNGLNERTNQELMKRLRCKINDKNNKIKTWTKLIDHVITEFNNTPHEVTGFSPAYLLYGIKPYDMLNSDVNIEQARELACQRSLKYHEKNKIVYDKNHQPPPFKTGDQVLVEIAWHPNNGKLIPVMEGPYNIIKKLSAVNYEINRPNRPTNRKTEVVHSNKLRLYHNPDNFQLELGRCNAP